MGLLRPRPNHFGHDIPGYLDGSRLVVRIENRTPCVSQVGAIHLYAPKYPQANRAATGSEVFEQPESGPFCRTPATMGPTGKALSGRPGGRPIPWCPRTQLRAVKGRRRYVIGWCHGAMPDVGGERRHIGASAAPSLDCPGDRGSSKKAHDLPSL